VKKFQDKLNYMGNNCYKYLKPGGILIIENIDLNISQNTYINNINHILCEYQRYYFVTINQPNHENISKIFVLIKTGAEPIFKNKNKITIITPSYRLNNLHKLKDSIDFNYVDEWIIVYDGNKITELTGLKQKELGEFIVKFKEYIDYRLKALKQRESLKYQYLLSIIDKEIIEFYEKTKESDN
jgi:hypothetical protein